MPPIAPLVRWDYGPINPDGKAQEWRTTSEWVTLIGAAFLLLIGVAFVAARCGWT